MSEAVEFGKEKRTGTGRFCLLTIRPAGIVCPVPYGTLLSDALREAGIALPLPCGGHGRCGKCGVALRKTALADSVTVLSCQTPVEGDWTVFLPRLDMSAHAIEVTGRADAEEAVYGCAVDLGSTTVALSLWRLDTGERYGSLSFENPQRCAGDDILSRIHAVQEDPQMLPFLARLIRSAIAEGVGKLLSACGIEPVKLIRYVLVGNTVMQQLFLELSPVPLGQSPFTPAFTALQRRRIGELSLPGKPDGTLFVFPQIGGFIGGDTLAGLLVLRRGEVNDGAMLVDLGTNAEIPWIRGGRIIVTSAAAGPALEGATLEDGCCAAPGAIQGVSDDAGNWRIRTVGDRPARGICGSGYLRLVEILLQRGILGSDGSLKEQSADPWSMRLRPHGDGALAFLVAGRTEGAASPCLLTQEDIRKIQLAKAAIAAGIELLLQSAGNRFADVRTWIVAGALGTAVPRSSFERLGLFPSTAGGDYHGAGNTALKGAEIFLLDPSLAESLERIQSSVTLVELADHPRFQESFIRHLNFPSASREPGAR